MIDFDEAIPKAANETPYMKISDEFNQLWPKRSLKMLKLLSVLCNKSHKLFLFALKDRTEG